jgi:hypothetical protein
MQLMKDFKIANLDHHRLSFPRNPTDLIPSSCRSNGLYWDVKAQRVILLH